MMRSVTLSVLVALVAVSVSFGQESAARTVIGDFHALPYAERTETATRVVVDAYKVIGDEYAANENMHMALANYDVALRHLQKFDKPDAVAKAQQWLASIGDVPIDGRAAWYYANLMELVGEPTAQVDAYRKQTADWALANRGYYVATYACQYADNPQQYLQDILLSGQWIDEWTPPMEKLFRNIYIADEPAWQAFCTKLFNKIRPVEANAEIKTLLKREMEGQ